MNDFYPSRPDDALFLPLIGALRDTLSAKKLLMATAESCTGGLMASLCTDMAGSSAWFAGGVVSYSNAMKEKVLGVPADIVREHGAVSEETVRHMARGALGVCGAGAAVAVSGVAGPDGGTEAKPVGTVWIAWALDVTATGTVRTEARRFLFPGNRSEVRLATAAEGFKGLLQLLQ